MISNSSKNKATDSKPALDQAPTDEAAAGEANSPSPAELFMEQLSQKWEKTVGKVRDAEALTKTNKKTIRRLLYGLPQQLKSDVAPLTKHVLSKRNNQHAFDQLVRLAESSASSSEAFDAGTLESFSPEVEPPVQSSDVATLAALSSLLIANRLRSVVTAGTQQQFERIVGSLLGMTRQIDAGRDSVLRYQWLAIELPLTLSAQLFAVKSFRKEGKLAAKRLVKATHELLDADGWPGSECLGSFAPLVASWTRCVKLADVCGFKLGSSFHALTEGVAEQFIRLHGPQRKLFFAGDDAARIEPSFVEFVLELDAEDHARLLAEAGGILRGKGKKKGDASFAETSCVSEWARSAILKSGWSPKSAAVGIDFSTSHSTLEVGARKRLISGSIQLELLEDGQPVDLGREGFDVVCELSDDATSYLELEKEVAGLTIFRQLLFSKKDHFLLFADSIRKRSPGEIDYRIKFPLARGVDTIRENGTREMYLNCNGIESLVLPLSLPEWSGERCRGLMSAEQDGRGSIFLAVEKAQRLHAIGGSLYCPVFFDLNPKRSRKKRTWRSLTVAENLEIVAPEIAAAFRVQVDEQQWIFYRALQSLGNRTFMGQNFAGDFFAAEFSRDGQVQELVEVE